MTHQYYLLPTRFGFFLWVWFYSDYDSNQRRRYKASLGKTHYLTISLSVSPRVGSPDIRFRSPTPVNLLPKLI